VRLLVALISGALERSRQAGRSGEVAETEEVRLDSDSFYYVSEDSGNPSLLFSPEVLRLLSRKKRYHFVSPNRERTLRRR